MIIDCMTCPVRGQRCEDCAVAVLHAGTATSSPGVLRDTRLQLDAAERRVVSMFVGAGLVQVGAAAKLRARPESADEWHPVWDVG